MKVSIEKFLTTPTDLEALEYVSKGGEGSIYRLGVSSMLGKIYHQENLDRQRQEKVLDLCSRYDTFSHLLSKEDFAFPEKTAKDENNNIVGFAMKEFENYVRLDEIFWKGDEFTEAGGKKLTEQDALKLIYDLYAFLLRLHKSRIVIGDLNPSNILYNFSSKKPAFIDLDSVQIDQFGCRVIGEDSRYLDPQVEANGINVDGCFRYTEDSDCFALAIIACELLTGGDPYMFKTSPPMDPSERRRKRISIIGYLEDSDFGSRNGHNLLDNKSNVKRLARFDAIRKKDPLLYRYLREVLLGDERENLLTKLPKTDKRHPEYAIRKNIRTIMDVRHPARPIDFSSVQTSAINEAGKKAIENILNAAGLKKNLRLCAMSTEDPDGFKMFLETFNLGHLLIGA